jgi:hypothetical protein
MCSNNLRDRPLRESVGATSAIRDWMAGKKAQWNTPAAPRQLRYHAYFLRLLLRFLYSPMRISISILPPCPTNSGNGIVDPVTICTGFIILPAVFAFTAEMEKKTPPIIGSAF